jgi:hypothetical protein
MYPVRLDPLSSGVTTHRTVYYRPAPLSEDLCIVCETRVANPMVPAPVPQRASGPSGPRARQGEPDGMMST